MGFDSVRKDYYHMYYMKNREKFLERIKKNNVKILCECGIWYARKQIKRHRATNKHLINMGNKSNENENFKLHQFWNK